MQKHTPTSAPQISLFTEDSATSLQADFHANLSAQQVNEKAQQMSVISGQKCCALLQKQGRATLLAKMLLVSPAWFSNRVHLRWKAKPLLMAKTTTELWKQKACCCELSEISKPSDTIASRLLFQLQPLTPRTEGIEFGSLLPTPKVGGTEGYETRAKRQGHAKAVSHLEAAVEYQLMNGLLPTPMAQNRELPTQEQIEKRKETYGGTKRAMYLEHFAAQGLLPTPTAQDGEKNSSLPPSQVNRNDSIVKRILQANPHTGSGFHLNPQFVLEMMGYPPNWTALPYQTGEKKA